MHGCPRPTGCVSQGTESDGHAEDDGTTERTWT